MKRIVSVVIVVAVLCLQNLPRAAGSNSHFAVPPGISDEVRFWKTVFGTYDRWQVIFHDDRHLGVIYRVLDFSGTEARKDLSPGQKSEIIQEQVRSVRGGIETSLERLALGVAPELLTDEEKYYQKLFESISYCVLRDAYCAPQSDAHGAQRTTRDEYKAAIGRIRVQTGQRSNLMRAIARSSQYIGDIEAIFELYGLPKELTAIVFIESMFNPKALSEVGASGLWQFMPDVGREYVSMNFFWDNRNDPIGSTDGAARMLRDLHDRTRDWALAINSYHSGLGRLEKAVKKLGTKDISVIIHKFNDPAYGFYSRNYYPEFLAVAEIYKNRAEYLGTVENTSVEKYDIIRTSDFVNLPKIAARFAIDMTALRSLNPAINSEVLSGELPLPPNYPLKVPKGMGYQMAIVVGYLPDK